MASPEEKFAKRRLRSSYFSTIISISLVLFVLGIVGLILLNAKKISDHIKENIGFTIVLKNDVKEVDAKKLQKRLSASPYIKETKYVTKQEAEQEFNQEHGEDFVEFLGYNPLPTTIDVKLQAEYAHPDSINWIKQEIVEDIKVKEVWYHKSLLEKVNSNVNRISFVLISFSGLLLIIAIALINNSIRLTIYSKRFLIRSMQLVGATKGFIRRPFVWKGIGHGISAAIIAISMLMGLIYYAEKEFPTLFELKDIELVGSLFGIVTVLGLLITWISTHLAVSKFLRMKTEKLY
jgi:cell division transport system permease protein